MTTLFFLIAVGEGLFLAAMWDRRNHLAALMRTRCALRLALMYLREERRPTPCIFEEIDAALYPPFFSEKD